ncbi:hypothetical protein [Euryhalocaulis caribicus]|uniref:hypothetical protein n=1 Tax=Euryhalocaulis caribicus TaxID=1161401 RepID=UPI0012695116|nr:hypothetical protein [Euryhalocaulis caribicus]
MDDYYVAEAPSLKRRMYICEEREGPLTGKPNVVSGWQFVVEEFDDNGKPRPLWDAWEEHYHEIIRYPEAYAPKDIIWKRNGTDEVVDIYDNPYVKDGE